MSPESIFDQVLRINDPAEQIAFLDAACGGDLNLRQEIELLMLAHTASGDFMKQPGVPLGPTEAEENNTRSNTSIDLSPGTLIAGRYTLEQKLGEGGMGEVWIARQNDPVKRKVAIKFIRPGMDTQAVIARFDQERQALAIMDHPNIAKILDGGTTENGRPFFVMELVRGLPITKYCDQEKLTPCERLALFSPICQGVQHAHQKGIIHRDIKPSNILVGLYDGKPVPKIIDFGVAKAIGQRISTKTVQTVIGSLLGTLEYMSPEQADLTNLDIDTRTDVYALGVILYELLTGTVPFTRNDFAHAGVVQMLMMIKEKEPQKPSTRISTLKELPNIAAHRKSDPASLRHLLEGELDWIIMKCLEKERTRRYDSPLSLAFDLERYLADEPVQAAPPSVLYRIKKFVIRHRGQVLAAGFVLLVLIGSVIATSIGMWKAWKAEVKALQSEELAKNEADLHRALLQYLEQDLFGQFDPEIRRQIDFPLNRKITVRALLDNAAKSVGKRFEDKPTRVQAALRRTLGIAFSSVGADSEALQQFETARLLIPGSDLLAVEINESLGIFLHNQGIFPQDTNKLKEAEKYLVEVIKVREHTRGLQDPATLRSRYELGSLERSLGKLNDAEQRLTLLLEDQRQVLPANDPDIPRTMNILADIYKQQKRDQDVEKIYRDALDICRKNLPLYHTQTLTAMNNLAHYLRTKRQFALAMQLYDELIPAATSVYDRDEPFLLIVKNNQAVCYEYLGKSEKAEAILQEVLETALRITSPENKYVLELKRSMANMPFRKKNWSKALQRFEDISPAFKKEFGVNDFRTWEVMENLAYCYSKTEKYDLNLSTSMELLRCMADQQDKFDSKRYYWVFRTAFDMQMLKNNRQTAELLLREAVRVIPEKAPEHATVKTLLENFLKEQNEKKSDSFQYRTYVQVNACFSCLHTSNTFTPRELVAC